MSAMSGDAQPCAPHIEPFERAKKLFLDQLSEEEQITYKNAKPDNLFYQASSVFHSGYMSESRLQTCRDALMPLVQAVSNYGELLAAPLSGAPVIGTFVSPIWGGLRVVIHFAQAVDQYFKDLIEMLVQIGESLPQYGDYHRLFPNHGRLMLLLSESLACILTFCKKVKDHFKNEKTSTRWTGKLLRHKGSRKRIGLSIPDYLDDFKSLRRRIELEAQISHMIEDKEHRYRQEENWALQEGRSRQMRLKEALSTLSKVNYKNRRRQLQSERYAGTGEWLLKEPSFSAWIESPASGCFYCFGIPGSGKSVLSSAIADHLCQEFMTPEDIHGFYFCDYKDLNGLKCSTLLGTLIRQALDLTPQPQMLVDWVLERVDEENSQPSTAELVDALTRVMGSRKRVFIVLDGIDELDQAEQTDLRTVMQSFLSLEESIVKIFVSCRAGVLELDSDPYPAVKLTITPDHVRDDIRHYIEQTVESKYLSEELQLGNSSLKKEIIQALSAGAKEMFLWVKFQIEELCLCYNDEEIRETLRDLPEGLADTYARILQKISNSKRGPKSLEIACSAFQWVICSARPLLVEELLEALTIRESDSTLHRDRVMTDARKLIQACGNLVTTQLDGTVRPAHHTVQQFLLRDDAEKKNKPECLSNGDAESSAPYSKREYVATNAGSVNSSHLRGIEHVRFFFEEGDRRLGRLCVAYLHFEDFESQVTIRQTDRMQIPAGIVKSIGSDFHGPSTVAGKVMSKVQRHSASSANIRNISLSIPKLNNSDREKSLYGEYKLLEYVRLSWPFHTDNFILNEDSGPVANLAFDRELRFETRPWRTTHFVKSIPRFRGDRKSQRFQEGRLLFYWALKHKLGFFHDFLKRETVIESDIEPHWPTDKGGKLEFGLFGAIFAFESARDISDYNLIETAAKWGPDQLSRILRTFLLLGFQFVPIRMLHQAFVVGSHEVRQFLYSSYYCHRSYHHGIPEGESTIAIPREILDVGFDDSAGRNQRFLGLGQPTLWFLQTWHDVSKDPQRIMSEIFVLSYPKNPDVLKFLFPLLGNDVRNDAVGMIIRDAKSDIQRASDNTKRNFIVESLVGILFPDHRELLSSVRIESGMEKWQDKWDREVNEAHNSASLSQVLKEIRKEEGGEIDDETRLKIALEKIEEVEREKGKQRREDGRTDALIQSLQVELQVIAMKERIHKQRELKRAGMMTTLSNYFHAWNYYFR